MTNNSALKKAAAGLAFATAFGTVATPANAEITTTVNPTNRDVTVFNDLAGQTEGLPIAPEGTSVQTTLQNDLIANRYGFPVIPDGHSILIQRLSFDVLRNQQGLPATFNLTVLIGKAEGTMGGPDNDIGNNEIYTYEPGIPQNQIFYSGRYTLAPDTNTITVAGIDSYLLNPSASWSTGVTIRIDGVDAASEGFSFATGQDYYSPDGNPALAWWADGMRPDRYAPLRQPDINEEQPYALASLPIKLHGTLVPTPAVPEPSSGALLGTSLLAAAFAGAIRRKVREMRTVVGRTTSNQAETLDSPAF